MESLELGARIQLWYIYTVRPGVGLGEGEGVGECWNIFSSEQISQWPWSYLVLFSLQPPYLCYRVVWNGLGFVCRASPLPV